MIGAVGGLIAFSHILSWVFKRFKNQTIAILTGFILGSLNILWPWKDIVYLKDEIGETIIKKGEMVVEKYLSVMPVEFNSEVMLALVFAIIGIASITVIELTASANTK